MKTIDIVSVHFGNPQWSQLQIERCKTFNSQDPRISNILIANNDRENDSVTGSLEQTWPGVVKTFTFPPDHQQIKRLGHDHGSSLDKLLAMSTADIVVCLDNDAHPIRPDWLTRILKTLEFYDAIAAPSSNPREAGYSHPCFLAFTRRSLTPLPYTYNPNENHDVGRMIRKQIEDRGMKVFVPDERRAFDGICGTIYSEIIYHQGSASFRYSELHASMMQWAYSYYERVVLNSRRYHRTFADRVIVFFGSRVANMLGWNGKRARPHKTPSALLKRPF